jgi:hypothetical protein
VEWGLYCENLVMIGQTVNAGDNFKKRATIPLAPCKYILASLGLEKWGDRSTLIGLQRKKGNGPAERRLDIKRKTVGGPCMERKTE